MSKIAFILASTDDGTLIVNRFDYKTEGDFTFGVGYFLLENGTYEPLETVVSLQVLNSRREHFGDGVVVLDCGANIGALTVKWAKAMTGWGGVMAIEPQERIYYALCGNIVLNNCFNACAIHAALGAEPGILNIPEPNYLEPGSFGSLELRPSDTTEDIGQPINRDRLLPVQLLTIDKLDLSRMDFIKVDVEGMEMDVLAGARQTLERFHPVIMIEHIKTRKESLVGVLSEYGYMVYELGSMNFLAIHSDDPARLLVK